MMRSRWIIPALLLGLLPGMVAEAQQRRAESPQNRAETQRRRADPQQRARQQGKAAPQTSPTARLVPIREAIELRDLVAARILIRELARSRITLSEWIRVREILFANPEIGSDVVLGWDRIMPPASDGGIGDRISSLIAKGDELLLANNPEAAFDLYQKTANWLKQRMTMKHPPKSASHLYPYVLHSMARALFASGRHDDALEVYSWLTPEYPRFRQSLFEKMWAAFKGKRLDHALGAIASQRSAYFSKYLEPEAYLIEIYILKVLCREQELRETMREIEEYKGLLESGRYDFKSWAKTDFETKAMLRLTEISPKKLVSAVTPDQRQQEQRKVADLLLRMFNSQKGRILEYLTVVQAYAQLAVTPGIGAGLQPVDQMPSRADLFKMNLEIWPADSAEDWIDELGRHRFMGESLCGKK